MAKRVATFKREAKALYLVLLGHNPGPYWIQGITGSNAIRCCPKPDICTTNSSRSIWHCHRLEGCVPRDDSSKTLVQALMASPVDLAISGLPSSKIIGTLFDVGFNTKGLDRRGRNDKIKRALCSPFGLDSEPGLHHSSCSC